MSENAKAKEAPAAQAVEAAVPTKGKKSGKGKIMIAGIGGLVLLGGIGFGAWFFMQQQQHKDGQGGKAAEVEAKAEVIYYALPDPVITGVASVDGNQHLLKVSMSYMTHDAKFVDALKINTPLVKNNILDLVGQQNYEALNTPAGKKALQAQILADAQTIIAKDLNVPANKTIDAVLFTDYVLD